MRLGDLLLEASRGAESRILLVAPFVKAAVLDRLVTEARPSVRITVVTRWRPNEIAGGSTDLECWDVVRHRPNSKFLLCLTVHAKYYSFDDRAYIGSANLTGRALGWLDPRNLELLEPSPMLDRFEEVLLGEAYEPTETLLRNMREAASAIQTSLRPPVPSLSLIGDEDEDEPTTHWLPRTRHPEDLYMAYSGKLDQLSSATRHAAVYDLEYLDLPAALPAATFEMSVRATLLATPLVQQLDVYLSGSRRFGEVRDWLAQMVSLERDQASAAWQTLMRWLLHFFPDRYERNRHRYTETIQRKQPPQ